MPRYCIELSYKGTNYHGWQYQPNALSVQEVVTNCFSTILQEDIEITGAGRTDTGVHATYFVAHFDSEYDDIENPKLLFRLNCFLPSDIAIHSLQKVSGNFHSRFDATSRCYEYHIITVKNPFLNEFAYYHNRPLDIEKMNTAAQTLFDYEDFSSFCKSHSDAKTMICEIHAALWKSSNNHLVFEISANRFLRNMVRAIVGTLLDVGLNKISVYEFQKIIQSQKRSKAGISVPPQGLLLTDIKYEKVCFKPKYKSPQSLTNIFSV